MLLLVVWCGVLGLVVGSFLNVVVWRVPRGESVVRPRSACPACGTPIRPRDNLPVLSWLLLRGRGRCCGARISPRYPLVEAGTAAAFTAVAAWLGLSWALPAFLYLASISIALALIDLDVRRLPDAIVLPSYAVAAVLLGAASLGERDAGAAVRAAVGCAALGLLYFVLFVVQPGGMGFGDVKLAGVLGLYLGWLGWAQLAAGTFLGFLVGGVVGVVLLLLGRAGRTSQVPFGPSMLAGAWAAVALGGTIADWYLGTAGL